jgi:hypothetical protein
MLLPLAAQNRRLVQAKGKKRAARNPAKAGWSRDLTIQFSESRKQLRSSRWARDVEALVVAQ